MTHPWRMIESALTNLWILLGFLLDGFWSDTHYFGKFVELELKHIFFFSLCEVAKVLRCSLELSCSFTDKCHTLSTNYKKLFSEIFMVLGQNLQMNLEKFPIFIFQIFQKNFFWKFLKIFWNFSKFFWNFFEIFWNFEILIKIKKKFKNFKKKNFQIFFRKWPLVFWP